MTARLILPVDATREEWLAARRQGVTASEIAVILGISPFDSPFNLYYKKRGEIGEDFDNDAMSLGRHLEPWIADRWAEDHPEWHILEGGLFGSQERPWQMATPDRCLIGTCGPVFDPAASLLEIKSSGTYDGWGQDGSDEIPPYYRAQVLWQLDTFDLTEAHVTCLFLPTRQRRDYVVTWDEADIHLMRRAAADFLARIENSAPPPIDHHPATTTALKALNPKVDPDAEVEVPTPVATAYREACAEVRRSKAAKALIENNLRDAMGSAKRAVCDGATVATRSIYQVAAHVRAASTVDKLTAPPTKKD